MTVILAGAQFYVNREVERGLMKHLCLPAAVFLSCGGDIDSVKRSGERRQDAAHKIAIIKTTMMSSITLGLLSSLSLPDY